MRLLESVKKQLVEKVKEGTSITQICKELKLSKATVYYYIKKIRGRKFPETKINVSDLEKIGELIGIFTGDGYFFFDKKDYRYYTFFFFSKKEKEYVNKFCNLLRLIINRYIYWYEYKNVNKIFIRVTSKKLNELIRKYVIWDEKQKRSYTIHLKNIDVLPGVFLIGFLRGLFDSDGYTYKDKREVNFVTISSMLAHQVSEILDILKIQSNIYVYRDRRGNRKKVYYVKVKSNNAEKFLHLIKPSNPNRYQKWVNTG